MDTTDGKRLVEELKTDVFEKMDTGWLKIQCV